MVLEDKKMRDAREERRKRFNQKRDREKARRRAKSSGLEGFSAVTTKEGKTVLRKVMPKGNSYFDVDPSGLRSFIQKRDREIQKRDREKARRRAKSSGLEGFSAVTTKEGKTVLRKVVPKGNKGFDVVDVDPSGLRSGTRTSFRKPSSSELRKSKIKQLKSGGFTEVTKPGNIKVLRKISRSSGVDTVREVSVDNPFLAKDITLRPREVKKNNFFKSSNDKAENIARSNVIDFIERGANSPNKKTFVQKFSDFEGKVSTSLRLPKLQKIIEERQSKQFSKENIKKSDDSIIKLESRIKNTSNPILKKTLSLSLKSSIKENERLKKGNLRLGNEILTSISRDLTNKPVSNAILYLSGFGFARGSKFITNLPKSSKLKKFINRVPKSSRSVITKSVGAGLLVNYGKNVVESGVDEFVQTGRVSQTFSNVVREVALIGAGSKFGGKLTRVESSNKAKFDDFLKTVSPEERANILNLGKIARSKLRFIEQVKSVSDGLSKSGVNVVKRFFAKDPVRVRNIILGRVSSRVSSRNSRRNFIKELKRTIFRGKKAQARTPHGSGGKRMSKAETRRVGAGLSTKAEQQASKKAARRVISVRSKNNVGRTNLVEYTTLDAHKLSAITRLRNFRGEVNKEFERLQGVKGSKAGGIRDKLVKDKQFLKTEEKRIKNLPSIIPKTSKAKAPKLLREEKLNLRALRKDKSTQRLAKQTKDKLLALRSEKIKFKNFVEVKSGNTIKLQEVKSKSKPKSKLSSKARLVIKQAQEPKLRLKSDIGKNRIKTSSKVVKSKGSGSSTVISQEPIGIWEMGLVKGSGRERVKAELLARIRAKTLNIPKIKKDVLVSTTNKKMKPLEFSNQRATGWEVLILPDEISGTKARVDTFLDLKGGFSSAFSKGFKTPSKSDIASFNKAFVDSVGAVKIGDKIKASSKSVILFDQKSNSLSVVKGDELSALKSLSKSKSSSISKSKAVVKSRSSQGVKSASSFDVVSLPISATKVTVTSSNSVIKPSKPVSKTPKSLINNIVSFKPFKPIKPKVVTVKTTKSKTTKSSRTIRKPIKIKIPTPFFKLKKFKKAIKPKIKKTVKTVFLFTPTLVRPSRKKKKDLFIKTSLEFTGLEKR